MTKTKVFISWSGERSKLIASALKEWLPDIIPELKPWMSAHDIRAGSRWAQDLGEELQAMNTGVICLTPENLEEPWLLFEAGALSKFLKKSRVIPFRFQLAETDLQPPLSLFQSVDASEEGTRELLKSLNRDPDDDDKVLIEPNRLEQLFRKFWPDLQEKLSSIRSTVEPVIVDNIDRHYPMIEWPPGDPAEESVLLDAKSNLLLIGTALPRATNEDLDKYHDWLEENPNRMIGFLFLNPNSPHAYGRSRKKVYRSSSDSIRHHLKEAYNQTKLNKRFVPAIYEGPYRYSARAGDIGQRRDEGENTIRLFTSSYISGTSKGFKVSLISNSAKAAYECYEAELIDIWKEALANPPGHGISMIYRSDEPLDQDIIRDVSDELVKRLWDELRLGDESASLHLFEPKQYHLTISSICRTQTQPFSPPLRLGNFVSEEEENLPAHFGDFLLELLQSAAQFFKRSSSLVFDQLTLDELGHVRIESKENLGNDFVQIVTDYREFLSDRTSEYARQYPKEGWTVRVRRSAKVRRDYRFYPRYETFLPHVTIGVAFDHTNGLPVRLTGSNLSIKLSEPLKFSGDDLFVVHYAYRTLLRCVGEYELPSSKDEIASRETILQKLGIGLMI